MDVWNEKTVTGFVKTMTGFAKTVTGFPKTMTGYDNTVTGFPRTMTGYDNTVTGFLKTVTGYAETVTGFVDRPVLKKNVTKRGRLWGTGPHGAAGYGVTAPGYNL